MWKQASIYIGNSRENTFDIKCLWNMLNTKTSGILSFTVEYGMRDQFYGGGSEELVIWRQSSNTILCVCKTCPYTVKTLIKKKHHDTFDNSSFYRYIVKFNFWDLELHAKISLRVIVDSRKIIAYGERIPVSSFRSHLNIC